VSLSGIKSIILVTAHRHENFGRPLESICLALKEIARRYADSVHIVYPVHLNPNAQDPGRKALRGIASITLLDPLGYRTLVHLMKRSRLIPTGSGGLQEEAPSLGVPVLVLRQVTERPEAVVAGTVRVVGVETDAIVAVTVRLLEDQAACQAMARAVNPYGDGKASERIVRILLEQSHV